MYTVQRLRGGADKSLAPTMKETSYSDQTRDLFNTLPNEAQYTS